MKSRWVVSKDFLKRISDPKSRYHSDYLAYRRGEITRRQLISRLPHVAMIGDSVCTGIYVTTRWSTFWRARDRHNGNWFLELSPTSQIQSVSRRLEEMTPFVATHHAGVGAMVDADGERETRFRRILGTRNMSGQIKQLVRASRFPDLVLISIGHNNVDWAWRCPPGELEQSEERLQRLRRWVRDLFARRLRPLIHHAQQQPRRVAIVVFGLINFETYFKGREQAEHLRAADSALYPHLETTYQYLTSFRPALRGNVIRLAVLVNDELRAMIDEFNRELPANSNVQLRYSKALATVDLSRAGLLHDVDAWHASAKGHNVLAEAAFCDLGPSLKFLGICPDSD
jgi:lysophospholipase L1-like esterase